MTLAYFIEWQQRLFETFAFLLRTVGYRASTSKNFTEHVVLYFKPMTVTLWVRYIALMVFRVDFMNSTLHVYTTCERAFGVCMVFTCTPIYLLWLLGIHP
jgi:hypothetical protein